MFHKIRTHRRANGAQRKLKFQGRNLRTRKRLLLIGRTITPPLVPALSSKYFQNSPDSRQNIRLQKPVPRFPSKRDQSNTKKHSALRDANTHVCLDLRLPIHPRGYIPTFLDKLKEHVHDRSWKPCVYGSIAIAS